jgi:AcrR family transcriptional regulator
MDIQRSSDLNHAVTEEKTLLHKRHNHDKKQVSEIINTSLHLIENFGLEGLSVRNLSSLTGIGMTNIYNNFGNENDILLLIIDHFKAEIEATLGEAILCQTETIGKIESIFKSYYHTFANSPGLTALLLPEEFNDLEPGVQTRLEEMMDQNNKVLTSLISEGQKKGEIRSDKDPRYLAAMALGSFRETIRNWQHVDSTNQ